MRNFPALQTFPVSHQFILMQFAPSFNQSPLPFRKRPSDHFDRLDAKDSHFLLVVSVEMRHMVLRTNLSEHANDDSEKAA